MSVVLNDRRVVEHLDVLMGQLDSKERELLKDLISLAGNDTEEFLKLLQQLATYDYKWRPVDMETFLLHPDYLGLKGQIFPKLVDDLVEMFEGGYHEAVLTGAIGWGKSTVAECGLCRMVYETSCLRNPQQAYGLMDGSLIAFINASVNLKQAEKVVFHGIKAKLNQSPYFRDQFPYEDSLKKEMRFPGGILIMPVAASEGGTVGYNVFGGVLDEVNFWQVVEKSAQARGQKFDQARTVYDMLIRRIKSRFNRGGKLPGILLQVSSSKYPDDFTEQRIKETRETGDSKTFIRRYSTWSTRPASNYMPERFYLYRGTTAERPFITKDKNEVADKDPELVLEVPMDFYRDFAADIDGAIRDLAGFPTLSIKPFMPQKDKVLEAIALGKRKGLVHPYSVTETTLEDGAYFDFNRCKFDPTRWYYAHVDLGLKKDRCGLAVGHIAGWKKVMHRDPQGNLVEDTQPVIVIDLMLRIKAPEGGEIQVDYVRALLLQLREHGCNFRKITYDQYQSASSIQAFQRMGIDADRFSVDKPMDAYNAFKEAILENRLAIYSYEPFLEEVFRLEHNEQKDKVDHPPKGSKDVTDAVSGVVYHCTMAKMAALADPSYGEHQEPRDAEIPDHWLHPLRGMNAEPTVDYRTGQLLPGKRLRTIDELLFPPDEPETGEYIGFA